METNNEQPRIWTRVSPDGKSAAAGAGAKPGAGGGLQPYDERGRYMGTLHAANTRAKTATDAGGGPRRSPLGGTKRGKEMGSATCCRRT